MSLYKCNASLVRSRRDDDALAADRQTNTQPTHLWQDQITLALCVALKQVMKIAVAPTIIALELLMFKKLPSRRIILSVLVVCMGILVATVSDSKVIR